jgi:hypothetical protein
MDSEQKLHLALDFLSFPVIYLLVLVVVLGSLNYAEQKRKTPAAVRIHENI